MKKLIEALKRFWKKHVCDDAPEGYDIDADVVQNSGYVWHPQMDAKARADHEMKCACAACRIDGPPGYGIKVTPPREPGWSPRIDLTWLQQQPKHPFAEGTPAIRGKEFDQVWVDELTPIKMPVARDVQQDPVTKAWHGRVDNYGQLHVEQVPEGKLGDYLAQLEQKPNDLPPMRNANRRFAFCFLATPREGDQLISAELGRVRAGLIKELETLFLDPAYEGQQPSGWRYKLAPGDSWMYRTHPGENLFKDQLEPLYL